MRDMPVLWSEGMFLRPQHFQSAERYWMEATSVSEKSDHEYNYGLRSIDLSKEAIANHQVQLNSCQARLRDGTLIVLGPGQELDRLDLKAAFATEPTVRVFLGVPKLQMGRSNVGTLGDGSLHRYVQDVREIQDENRGGNEQEVQVRALNVKLLLSTQDLAGYEVLPIAQIERAGEMGATPQLDTKYIPSVLACDAWPPLGRDIVQAIYDIIGKTIEWLSEQVLSRGISFSSHEPGDLDRVLMLSLLNTAYCTLRVLAFAKGVHPFVAYTELCRIVGQLSIFANERRPPDVPVPDYDHDDLAGIFFYVKRQIERLVAAVPRDVYKQRFFVGAGMGMQVTFEPEWLTANWQWYVGVKKGELSETHCRDLLSSGQLDWKLGSSSRVDMLFSRRMPGLDLRPLQQAPAALPPTRDWVYYQVSRDSSEWKYVQSEQSLAMRLKKELIVNVDSLQGQRTLVVNMQGKGASLQFALFAVPIQK
jgi:type VI secretion system protein ImpJ